MGTYKDGTCASQGYTVKGQSKVIPFPKGNVTLTQYTKPAEIGITDDCQLYTLKNAPSFCVLADMPCSFTGSAKARDPTYKDGTCASQGYNVKGQSKVMPFPKGNVTLTEYTKSS